MATNGVLPSNPLHRTCFPCSSTLSGPHNHPPPIFKAAATSTAQNLGLRDPAAILNYPQASSRVGIAQNIQRLGYHPRLTDGLEESIADLNRIISKGSLSLCECRQVHGRWVKWGGLGVDKSIGDKLIKVYLKNEYVDDAQRLFDEIPHRSASAYAKLIASYCKSQQWSELFSVFQLMINDGYFPDKYLFPTIIKAVSTTLLVRSGKMVHGYGLRRGLCEDVFVGNALIHMYANFDELRCANAVFNSLRVRDVVSWTALVSLYLDTGDFQKGMLMFRKMQLNGLTADLIAWNTLVLGLARNGEIDVALRCVEEMQESGITPNANTWNSFISGCVQSECYEFALNVFVEMLCNIGNPNCVTVISVLSACSGMEDLMSGMTVHSYALKLGLCEDIHVAGSLINMYSKCGYCDCAEIIFCRMSLRNTTIWNEMIASYVNDDKLDAALELFLSMKDSRVEPDEITYNIVLGASARQGKKNEAYSLLHEMSQVGLKPNIITFNNLISGFQQSGLSREALQLFKSILSPSIDILPGVAKNSLQPNPVTISSALAACANLDVGCLGRQLHGYVLRNSMDTNIFVSSTLVDVYAKHGDMGAAEEVFRRIENKNTVSWNTLMAGYVLNKQPRAVFPLFNKMLQEGMETSVITFMILIQACGETGALRLGRELHGYLVKNSMYMANHKVASALIDMYSKCNNIVDAELVFQSEKHKDVALWNSMISSFSAHRMSDKAMALFEQMQVSGVVPDKVTFVGLLSACAHAGLCGDGWRYFHQMESFGIVPTLEHYTCMVSVMGAVGLLDEALAFIWQMPFKPDVCIWAALLRACREHSNPDIGERAARSLFELEPGNALNYILLANIYSAAGLHDSVRELKNFMKGQELLKVKECSSVDVSGKVYDFSGSINSPSGLENVKSLWKVLVGQMEVLGHSPLNPVLGEEEELDPLSCLHTEKLAICFGIISSNAFRPIRVSKNSRMCVDCHTSAKLITKITGREIFVKDVRSYHHMKDGVCSCKDRW